MRYAARLLLINCIYGSALYEYIDMNWELSKSTCTYTDLVFCCVAESCEPACRRMDALCSHAAGDEAGSDRAGGGPSAHVVALSAAPPPPRVPPNLTVTLVPPARPAPELYNHGLLMMLTACNT